MDLTVTSAKLTGDMSRDVKTLANHVFQLEENLRYALRNLDVTNFNDLGLARYENGRLQVYSKVVEVQASKLKVEFGKETDEIYAHISATAEELLSEIGSVDSKYGTLNSKVTQTANEVSAIVSSIGAGGEVTAASIVAAINADGDSQVKISANKVDVTGIVTFSDLASAGRTVVNGNNITTGVIDAVDFVARGDMYSAPDSMTGFVAENPNEIAIGRVGYGNNPNSEVSEYEYQRRDQLYLATYEYDYYGYRYRPTVKIQGAGGVSVETNSGSPVYIKGSSYLTLTSDIVIIIRDNKGTEWQFRDGGLFKNGDLKVS